MDMPKESTQNTPADKSRRSFLSKFSITLALVAGVVASGSNIICFTTGRGSCFGFKPTPSLKIATNTNMYNKLHDDMDINLGKIKAKFGGGSAGHNGIESIDKSIGKDYSRVRVGIGHPKEDKKSNSHVLEDFDDNEDKKIQDVTENIVKLIPTLINKEIETFSSKVNQNLNGF